MTIVRVDLEGHFTTFTNKVTGDCSSALDTDKSPVHSFRLYAEDANGKTFDLHPLCDYANKFEDGLTLDLKGLSAFQLQALQMVLRSPRDHCDCHTFANLLQGAETVVPLISSGNLTIQRFHELRCQHTGLRTKGYPYSMNHLLASKWDELRFFVACNKGQSVHSFICLPASSFGRPLILHKRGYLGVELSEPSSLKAAYEFDEAVEFIRHDVFDVV